MISAIFVKDNVKNISKCYV